MNLVHMTYHDRYQTTKFEKKAVLEVHKIVMYAGQ